MISIRHYLLRFLIVALLVNSLAIALFTYLNAAEGVNELYDKNLQEVAIAMQGQLAEFVIPDDAGRYAVSTTQQKLHGEEEYLIQLWKGERLYYSSHPAIPLPLQPEEKSRNKKGVFQTYFNNRIWLVYQQRTKEGIVQVSQPKRARAGFTNEIGVRMLIPILLQIPLLGVLIWLAVGKSLRPLAIVSQGIKVRSASSLIPFAEQDVPLEIAPVIAELNGLMARLSTALEAQRQFVADAAHELRTPLTALRLQLEVLERATTDAERKRLTSKLHEGIERSTRLVQQLLTLARLEPESVTRSHDDVALAPIVRAVVETYAEAAAEKQIDLGISSLEDAIFQGDAESIRILLSNLVDNALRFTSHQGKVDIAIYQENGSIVIAVEDNGIGIPEDQRELVFERFHRVLGTQVEGTGLGLAIVRNIVEHHGGSIGIRTPNNKCGTLVTIKIPCH